MMTDHPNFDSIEIMRAVDAMPKKWRALVHEYGVIAVMDCWEQDMDLADADDALWMGRNSRQAQWLATNFITKRSATSWGNNASPS